MPDLLNSMGYFQIGKEQTQSDSLGRPELGVGGWTGVTAPKALQKEILWYSRQPTLTAKCPAYDIHQVMNKI